jgi:ribosomal protein S1
MSEQTADLLDQKAPEEVEIGSPTSVEELSPKMRVTGRVERLELYGAFVDIGVGTSAILHISKLGKRVNRVSDVLSVDEEIEAWIESVDIEKGQITLTMQEPFAVDWSDLKDGDIYTGRISRIEKYGAFVDIGAEKDGLVHISELSHDYVKHPSEAVKAGDEVQVKVIGFNKRKRRIDLSRKALLEDPEAVIEEEIIEEEEEEEIAAPTAMEIAMRRALSQSDDSEESVPETQKIKTPSSKARGKQEDLLSRTLKLSKESESS